VSADLVAFLRARFDEETARQQDHWEQWHHRDCEAVPQVLYPERETGTCDCGVPTRVLADIDAKRKLLTEYTDSEQALAPLADMYDVGRVEGLLAALRLLALPYASHEDYRNEWAP